jgi:hypothetical protein
MSGHGLGGRGARTGAGAWTSRAETWRDFYDVFVQPVSGDLTGPSVTGKRGEKNMLGRMNRSLDDYVSALKACPASLRIAFHKQSLGRPRHPSGERRSTLTTHGRSWGRESAALSLSLPVDEGGPDLRCAGVQPMGSREDDK